MTARIYSPAKTAMQSGKGKTGFSLTVQGKAGHAAFSISEKPSAILELSRKIIEIEKLNNPPKQRVVNVGVVEGGIGANTIPEKAQALIDTRYLTERDGEQCMEALLKIAEQCLVPQTRGILQTTSSRQPMLQSIQNTVLFKQIQQVADDLRISVKQELRSGVSDANVIAATGTPVIDGLGPIGDCDHSDKEYMIKHTLPERTLLATAAILSCWRNAGHGSAINNRRYRCMV